MLLIYYVIINLVTFVLFCLDKHYAKAHKWRIPEATLMTFSALGGCFGGFLAMKMAHHKTKKIKFSAGVPLCMLLHVALLVYLQVS